MRHHSFAVVAVSLLAAMSLSPLSADSTVQTRVQALLDDQQLTGAAWAFVHPDGEIDTGSAGFANFETRKPFSPDSRIHVGSVTKVLLATGILRLVTQGRLDLDDPVAQYLPGVRFNNPWQESHPVTVRHLLDHTAGLDDARLWQMFSGRIVPDVPLSHAFSRTDNVLQIRIRPGSRLSYSNTGYTLLAMIIESITGVRYEAYLDAHLLEPLDMQSSTFHFTTQEGVSADPDLVWGHTDNGNPHPAVPVMLRPATQFTTTARDLAVFARFLMSDGSIDGENFVQTELMRARGHASTTEAADAGLSAGYALGLARFDRFGAVGFCHSGNMVGFVALLCIYPEAGKAFVVSVNTDSEVADYSSLYETLAGHLDLPPPKAASADAAATDIHDWHGWYRLAPNRFTQFAYLDELFAVIQLRGNDGILTLAPLQGHDRILRPAGGYFFVADDRITTSHVLMRTASEDFLISDGFRTYEKTSPIRLSLLWISLTGGLAGLLWFVSVGVVAFVKHRRAAWRRPEIMPFLGVLAILLALPLFLTQSFVQLGDVTPASAALAVATGLLPFLALVTMWRLVQMRRAATAHTFFVLCILQWCAVLAAWQLLPFRLWA